MEKIYHLRGDIAVLKKNNDSLIILSEGNRYQIFNPSDMLIETLKELGGRGVAIDFDNEPKDSVLNKLRSFKLLVKGPPDGLTKIQDLNYTWGETFYSEGNIYEKISNSSVLIIGCGGTGCIVAQSLAGAGVNDFTLVDFDSVEDGNLNRQFAYRVEDIGKYKVDALSSRLKTDLGINNVQPVVLKVQRSTDFKQIKHRADLIICCADKPSGFVQRAVAIHASQKGIAALYGGVGVWKGTIGPLLRNKHDHDAFIRRLDRMLDTEHILHVEPRFPSNGVTNSIIANLIALEALRYLAGFNKSPAFSRALDFSLNDYSCTEIAKFEDASNENF